LCWNLNYAKFVGKSIPSETPLILQHRNTKAGNNCELPKAPELTSTPHTASRRVFNASVFTDHVSKWKEMVLRVQGVPCPVFASFTLAFALQLRKKHRKTSVKVRKTSITVQYTYYQNTHTLQNTYITKHTHTTKHIHTLQNTHITKLHMKYVSFRSSA
jgi:hypothetical protein